jgi:hypothetical protein
VKPPSRAPRSVAAAAREPAFRSAKNKPVYDEALEGMHAIDALRGKPMSDALANDLGFKCADLKDQRKVLEAEGDPLVWRLREAIAKTCGYDVPLACAFFELQAIQTKRAGDAGASVDGECRALKLALSDLGTAYVSNPAAADVIGKETMYCEGADSVRRIP